MIAIDCIPGSVLASGQYFDSVKFSDKSQRALSENFTFPDSVASATDV